MKHKLIPLKNLARITPGYPFRGKINEVKNSGIFSIQMKDTFRDTGIEWSKCIETVLPGKRSPYWLQPSDILVAARGNQNYAVQVGQGIAERKAVASPHFFIVSNTKPEVAAEYLTFALNYGPCQSYFRREAEGSLTKSIRRPILENAPIPLPSFEIQLSIVAIVKTVQKERKLAEDLIQNGETLLHSLANQFAK